MSSGGDGDGTDTGRGGGLGRRLAWLAGHPAWARMSWRVGPAARLAIAAGLIGFIVWRLQSLGWARVWAALPTAPGFYLTGIVLFFLQPLADVAIFRRLWPAGGRPGLRVMLRKRFLNASVIDYSGEGYLFAFARTALPGQDRLVLHTIKDSNILSASASLLVLVVLVTALVALVPARIELPASETMAFAVLIGLSVLPVGAYLAWPGKMTVVGSADLRFVFAVHLARAVGVNLLVVLMWWQGMTGVAPLALMELLALRLLASRLPFVGNKDLVFLGGSIGLGEALAVPQASLAAVVLAAMALELVLNLVLVGLPWLGERLAARRD